MCDFDDFFDDLEIEDFAWVGGAIGFIEEEMNERIRIEREMERERERDDEIEDDPDDEIY
jgi:hypothetical protein